MKLITVIKQPGGFVQFEGLDPDVLARMKAFFEGEPWSTHFRELIDAEVFMDYEAGVLSGAVNLYAAEVPSDAEVLGPFVTFLGQFAGEAQGGTAK